MVDWVRFGGGRRGWDSDHCWVGAVGVERKWNGHIGSESENAWDSPRLKCKDVVDSLFFLALIAQNQMAVNSDLSKVLVEAKRGNKAKALGGYLFAFFHCDSIAPDDVGWNLELNIVIVCAQFLIMVFTNSNDFFFFSQQDLQCILQLYQGVFSPCLWPLSLFLSHSNK